MKGYEGDDREDQALSPILWFEVGSSVMKSKGLV